MPGPLVGPVTLFFAPFAEIDDWRSDLGKRHNLLDILMIALCAVVCGADDCEEIAEFGRANEGWFRTFLELPHGIPSQDTFLRFFAKLNPDQFRRAFIRWVESFRPSVKGKQIAVDGKTLRRSFDRAKGKLAIHMVSAWFHEAGLVLGQVKTSEKSNEITAVPELLKMIDINGATVTGDAMNCQREITKVIDDGGGEYVLQVKDNQPTMRDEIERYFASEAGTSLPKNERTHLHLVEKDHGRLEERTYWHSNDIGWFADLKRWRGLKGFGMMQSRRTILGDGKTTTESHYYITSFDEVDVRRFAANARGQWTIETQLHWRLDVAFDEDRSRLRVDHAAENFAVTRHIALNLLKRMEEKKKKSIKIRRKRCAWDRDYLLQVLGFKVAA
jgi:predicted transposase YbfD/YdcC